MRAAAADSFIELDAKTSAIEAAAKHVRLVLVRGAVGAVFLLLGAISLFYLWRIGRHIAAVRALLAETDVETDRDRSQMRNVASHLGQAAAALDAAHAALVHRPGVRIPIFNRMITNRLEVLSFEAEDVAETAALAASAAFARLVEKDLGKTRWCAHDLLPFTGTAARDVRLCEERPGRRSDDGDP